MVFHDFPGSGHFGYHSAILISSYIRQLNFAHQHYQLPNCETVRENSKYETLKVLIVNLTYLDGLGEETILDM